MRAIDGVMGKVRDIYFDNEAWTVRYIVVDTGNWLSGRSVLISPESLEEPDTINRAIPVRLTKQQIEESPHIDSDQPVSRQLESELAKHYGWPHYWGATAYGVAPPTEPPIVGDQSGPTSSQSESESKSDCHLRSVSDINGYVIQAVDGEIGHVEDLVIETRPWVICFFVVDTRNSWPGEKVLAVPGMD